MVTVVYTLETGKVERITSMPLDMVVEQFDSEIFGVFKTDVDASPVDTDRYHVVDGKLTPLVVPPNILVLKDTRSNLLSRTDWLSIRHRDQLEASIPTSLTSEQFSELMVYRQALRDWPVSGDYNEPYPAQPSWM
jgi:hypothetical protein